MSLPKRLRKHILLAIIALLTTVQFTADRTQAQTTSIIRGRVVDSQTQQPIPNATIQFWDTAQEYATAWRLLRTTQTDPNGQYTIAMSQTAKSRIYIFYDDATTPGVDYVPAYQDIYLSEEKNLTHKLQPGSSLIIEGELRFVESTKPSDIYTFTVVDSDTGSKPQQVQSIYDYGAKSLVRDSLRLDPRHIIIPADTPIDVLVNASIVLSNRVVYRTFLLRTGTPFSLGKGQRDQVDIGSTLSQLNLQIVQNHVELAGKSLDEVEQKGFYVTLERRDLAKAEQLVDTAARELIEASYDAAHTDLREAYVGVIEIDRRLGDMYANATSSVTILTLFLILTAVALTSIIFEELIHRTLGTCAFCGLFFLTLYFVYPGVRLISSFSLLLDAGLGLATILAVFLIISRFADQRFLSIFSLGRQNMMRRRLRFILTLISVTVLAMSFVTFTSYSTGFGLTTKSFPAPASASGVLVRQPLPTGPPVTLSYVPLEPSTIAWLQGKAEVLNVAPKFENNPELISIATLSAARSSEPLPLFGVLAIQPSAEAEITHLDDTMIRGDYLDDQSENGVLISQRASEKLGVEIGEELLFASGSSSRRVFLEGIFDDDRFGLVRDVDAQSLIPKKLNRIILNPDEPPIIEIGPCDPSEVIIMNWQTALEGIHTISLSRIDFKLSDPSSALSVSRQIALERGLTAYYPQGGNVIQVGLGEYVEAKGLPVTIPWIIVVLNVVITMLNSMFERRKEIAILSSIGLNPSHIGGIFMAEAAIIGVVGGGLGYLFGLGGYKGMLALAIAAEVRQKVSALWSLASLGVAVAAVLVGTGVALRSSVVITPSLLRKWTRGEKLEEKDGQWEFQMPIRLHEDGVAALFDHLKKRIPDHILSAYPRTDSDWIRRRIRESEAYSAESHTKSVFFNYFIGQSDPIGSSPFSLVAEMKRGDETYTLKLVCKGGEQGSIEKKVTYIRMLIVDWDAQRK